VTVKNVFTEVEVAYLRGQNICHLATANKSSDPHVVPLRFRFNAELETIDLAGHGDPTKKKYYRNLLATGKAALVVDSGEGSGRVRAVQVRGTVELLHTGGETVQADFDPPLVRVHPTYVVSWGLTSTNPFIRNGRAIGEVNGKA
jgi:pyridoxamine 5'-phosphate oxidase family protein